MEKIVFFADGIKIQIKLGDITEEDVDAIVNAANNRLIMGGGVAGAIRKKGGSAIQDEALQKGPIEIGGAIVTGAGNLRCRWIIHAATMGTDGVTDAGFIRCATHNSLALALKQKISSIAFPALGCGVGGFPAETASEIMMEETCALFSRRGSIEDVRFVLFDHGTFDIFARTAERILTPLVRKTYRNPFPTVDIIIKTPGGIVLINRKNFPPGWALPGGFVDPDESVEDAAVREAKEETGLNITDLRQFRVYSSPGRDPRFHTIATVFTASAQGSPVPGDDAAQSCVFQPNKLPEKMAFDHLQIISDWLAATKEKSENRT